MNMNRAVNQLKFSEILMFLGLVGICLWLPGCIGEGDCKTKYYPSRVELAITINDGAGNFAIPPVRTFTPAIGKLFTLGDIDGDTRLDLIFLFKDGTGVILRSDDYTEIATLTLSGIGDITSVISADANGDSNVDLVCSQGGAVVSYLGDGFGGFSLVSSILTPTIYYIESANFLPGDAIDLVAKTSVPKSITILLNDGTGRFTEGQNFPVSGSQSKRWGVGDLDGSGVDDVVTITDNPLEMNINLNNGFGVFPSTSSISLATNLPNNEKLKIGRFDGDVLLDVLFFSAQSSSEIVYIFSGNGAGGFAVPTFQVIPFRLYQRDGADINGDGIQDIYGNGNGGRVILQNSGSGIFSNETLDDFPRGAMMARDADGDGFSDFVIFQYFPERMEVIEEKEPWEAEHWPPCN